MLNLTEPEYEGRVLDATPVRPRRDRGVMIALQDTNPAFPWAEVLTAEERRRVEADSVVRSAHRGEYVCRKGAPVEYWTGVVDGLVKLCASDTDGRMTTHIAFASGGWWGDAALQRDEPRNDYDAIALRDSQIVFVPRSTLLWLLQTNIRFSNFLLRMTAERSLYFLSLLESSRLHNPIVQVALCLAALLNPWLQAGMHSHIEISQEEIGHLVGLSRQKANQVLRALKERGLLEMNYRGVTVLDVDGLRVVGDANTAVASKNRKTVSARGSVPILDAIEYEASEAPTPD